MKQAGAVIVALRVSEIFKRIEENSEKDIS